MGSARVLMTFRTPSQGMRDSGHCVLIAVGDGWVSFLRMNVSVKAEKMPGRVSLLSGPVTSTISEIR